MSLMFAQGDILIRRIENTPSKISDIAKEDGQIVVAHGEVSGHRHIITDNTALFFKASPQNRLPAELYIGTLSVSKETEMIHDEHKPIKIPAGTYEISRQREAEITANNEVKPRIVAD